MLRLCNPREVSPPCSMVSLRGASCRSGREDRKLPTWARTPSSQKVPWVAGIRVVLRRKR